MVRAVSDAVGLATRAPVASKPAGYVSNGGGVVNAIWSLTDMARVIKEREAARSAKISVETLVS